MGQTFGCLSSFQGDRRDAPSLFEQFSRIPPRDWARALPVPVEGHPRDFVGCRTPGPAEVAGAVEVAEGDGEGDVLQRTALRCRIRCHTGEDARSPHHTPLSSGRFVHPRQRGTERRCWSSPPRQPPRERELRRLATARESFWLAPEATYHSDQLSTSSRRFQRVVRR